MAVDPILECKKISHVLLLQTMDATWLVDKEGQEDKDAMMSFILRRKMEKLQDSFEIMS